MKRLGLLMLLSLLTLPLHAQDDDGRSPPISIDNYDAVIEVAELPRPYGNVLDLEWSPTDDLLALATSAGVQIYRLDGTTMTLWAVHDPNDYATRIAWSPDGKLIASGVSLGGAIWIWDADSGARVATLAGLPGESQTEQVIFSPDGTQLLNFSLSSPIVQVWSVPGGDPITSENGFQLERIAQLEHVGGLRQMAMSPDGTYLVTSGSNNMVGIWYLPDFGLFREIPVDQARGLAFAADGRLAYTANEDGDMQLIPDVESYDATFVSLETPIINPDMPTFNADGTLLMLTGGSIASDNASLIVLVDADPVSDAYGSQIDIIPDVHAFSVNEIDFNPDGTVMATLGWSDNVRVWTIAEERFAVVTEPPAIAVDGQAVVTLALNDDTLNVRAGAGTGNEIVVQLAAETVVNIIGGPQQAEGLTWWQIATEDGASGWAVDAVGEETTLRAIPVQP